jgi:AcrR family transcriptional regulator
VTAPRRPRLDPRSEATRLALIERAETLFAEAGVDGVSLRQIGTAIGSANTNVVAYHFGDKDALVIAIFKHRLAAFDLRRAEMLAAAERVGADRDLAVLTGIMYRPFLEQVNSGGRRSYAAFLEGVFRSGRIGLRIALGDQMSATNIVIGRMREACAHVSDDAFARRLGMCFSLASSATRIIDQLQHNEKRAEAVFADTLHMIEAALRAVAD